MEKIILILIALSCSGCSIIRGRVEGVCGNGAYRGLDFCNSQYDNDWFNCPISGLIATLAAPVIIPMMAYYQYVEFPIVFLVDSLFYPLDISWEYAVTLGGPVHGWKNVKWHHCCGCCCGIPDQYVLYDYNVVHDILYSKDDVELPGGYNIENFKSLVMKVKFKEMSVEGNGSAVEIPKIVQKNLRDELTKMKRFTVLLPDPDADTEAYDEAPADLLLTVTLQASKAKYPYDGHKYKYIYTVMGTSSLVDAKTNKALQGEEIQGRAARLTLFRGENRIGGFNEYAKNEVAEVLTVASLRAFRLLFGKLGWIYPVGGRITGVSPSGEYMTLDKGVESGVGAENQQFTIFLQSEGVDIPLCYADGKGGVGKSQLKPWKWAESKDAEVLQEEFEASPKKFFATYKESLYAVGWGLSVPAEWDQDGNNKELDKLLEN